MTETSATDPSARARLWNRLTTAACVAVALAFAVPMLVTCFGAGHTLRCELTLNRLGGGDWRYFAEAWEAARVALVDFHQFPSWNPYHCGGLVLYQEPQTPFPAPLFLLTFAWLPVAMAYKVWLLAHLVVGALGTRALLRERGANHTEQLLGAVLVTATGFWAHRMGGGHPSFTPFLLLPYLLWAERRALDEPRWAILVAALLALTVYEGGTYPLPLMLAALGIDAVARLGSERDRRGLAIALAIVSILFPLLAAARLVPVLAYLREHPRLVPLDDAMTVAEVFQSWLTRSHEWTVAGHKYVWPEYGNYMGIVPVLLMLAGVVVAILRRDPGTRTRRLDLALLVGLVWCALGNIPGLSLFGLLHLLPIYESLRVPSRFLGAASVPFALLAVAALEAARRTLTTLGARRWVQRAWLVFEGLLVLGVATDLIVTAAPLLRHTDPIVQRGRASAGFSQRAGVDYTQLPSFPVRGTGTRQCYTPIEWKPADGIVEGDGPQARLEPADAGVVQPRPWTPNVLAFQVELKRPATLIVNQNYETGWRASSGRVGAYRGKDASLWTPGRARPPGPKAVGLLAVELPAGQHEVVLRHRPPGLALGIMLTVVGLALAFAVARTLTPARQAQLRRAARRAFAGHRPPP